MTIDFRTSPLIEAFKSTQLVNAGIPTDLIDIIAEYLPEYQAKVPQITLTFWETIRNLVLCILTLGIWSNYYTHKYNRILLTSVNGSGIPRAIEAIKWGANTRPSDGTLEYLQENKRYKEYEFAFAQYACTERYLLDILPFEARGREMNSGVHMHGGSKLPFVLSSPLKDKKIWAIHSQYKTMDWAESDLYGLYSRAKYADDTALVERFHNSWNSDERYLLLAYYVRQNDINSLQVILKAIQQYDRDYFKEPYHSSWRDEAPDPEENFVIYVIQLERYAILESIVALDLFIPEIVFDTAIKLQKKEAVSILLKSPSIKVRNEHIALGFLPDRNREIQEMLIHRHPDPIKVAIQHGKLTDIQWMLDQGIRPNESHLAMLKEINNVEYYELLVRYMQKSDKVTVGVKEVSRLSMAWQRVRMSLDSDSKESLDD